MYSVQLLSTSLITLKTGGGTKKMVKNHDLVQYDPEKKVLERHGDEVEVKIEGTFPPKYFWKESCYEICSCT